MSHEQILIDEINECFSDYYGDFSVSVQTDEIYGGYASIEVRVDYKPKGKTYHFFSRVNLDDGDCELDASEDCWMPITTESLFKLLWFTEIED